MYMYTVCVWLDVHVQCVLPVPLTHTPQVSTPPPTIQGSLNKCRHPPRQPPPPWYPPHPLLPVSVHHQHIPTGGANACNCVGGVGPYTTSNTMERGEVDGVACEGVGLWVERPHLRV